MSACTFRRWMVSWWEAKLSCTYTENGSVSFGFTGASDSKSPSKKTPMIPAIQGMTMSRVTRFYLTTDLACRTLKYQVTDVDSFHCFRQERYIKNLSIKNLHTLRETSYLLRGFSSPINGVVYLASAKSNPSLNRHLVSKLLIK